MDEIDLSPATEEITPVAREYLRSRVRPHPILNPYLADAAVCVSGAAAFGIWDEASPLELVFILPDEEHGRLSTQLRQAELWDPARDFRLRLEDREPFRRFPGAAILILSTSQLDREFRYELPTALWSYTHSVAIQDPIGTLETAIRGFAAQFEAALGDLRCEHYYLFRRARRDISPPLTPRRLHTVLAIERGEAVREALRLAFLADGKPYPDDKWLEIAAERETRCGSGIVNAVRALVAARELPTVERAVKVLRDRVAFALQQGGVSEPWLEQWWLWPSIAPTRPLP